MAPFHGIAIPIHSMICEWWCKPSWMHEKGTMGTAATRRARALRWTSRSPRCYSCPTSGSSWGSTRTEWTCTPTLGRTGGRNGGRDPEILLRDVLTLPPCFCFLSGASRKTKTSWRNRQTFLSTSSCIRWWCARSVTCAESSIRYWSEAQNVFTLTLRLSSHTHNYSWVALCFLLSSVQSEYLLVID